MLFPSRLCDNIMSCTLVLHLVTVRKYCRIWQSEEEDVLLCLRRVKVKVSQVPNAVTLSSELLFTTPSGGKKEDILCKISSFFFLAKIQNIKLQFGR